MIRNWWKSRVKYVNFQYLGFIGWKQDRYNEKTNTCMNNSVTSWLKDRCEASTKEVHSNYRTCTWWEGTKRCDYCPPRLGCMSWCVDRPQCDTGSPIATGWKQHRLFATMVICLLWEDWIRSEKTEKNLSHYNKSIELCHRILTPVESIKTNFDNMSANQPSGLCFARWALTEERHGGTAVS